ncbi:MAG: FtsX-like permease family protein [bacterium]|nr:FtsX-like permease family protein [bacterium]
MHDAVQGVDPRLLLAGFATFDDIKWQFLAGTRYRFLATIFSMLAGFALLLSALGIYGLIANSVAERTRELGIRIALGASVSRVMRSAALPGVVLAAAGIAIGGGLSLATAPLLRAFVWGVSPTDPATLFGVGAVLLLVAAAASFVPALRVTRLNPAETLREE